MRILFIDDSDDMRKMMALLLDRNGYEVKTAESATDAFAIVPAWQPHIIVSDIGMPGIDGYELMRQLRADSQLKPFRSVALSGFANSDIYDEGRSAGFDECLTKPVEFGRFFSVLRSLEATLSPESLTEEDHSPSDLSDAVRERPRSATKRA